MATNEEKKLTQGSNTQNQQNTATDSQSAAAAPYTPSAAVTQAQQLLNQQQANKPGAYQSTWQQQERDAAADGIYSPETQETAGGLSADEAYNKYVLKKGSGGSGFTGSTYSEAAAYLKSQGISASGLMTQSEWQRHKNGNNSAGGEHTADSYQHYLEAYMLAKGL